MRRVAIDMNAVALAVTIQAVAKPTDVVKRDQMIGLAEHAEHRTVDRGDDVVERPRILGVDLPFARLGRPIPDQRRGDRPARRDHQWQPRGLANAHDRQPGQIGLRDRLQGIDGASERDHRVRIADVAADVAAMQRRLVRVPEVEIGRDCDQAVAREALGQIAGVLHQAVALMHHDHGGRLGRRLRDRDERRHAVRTLDRRGADALHYFEASARKLASM